ncbi:MAG: fibronectin type III domain-containing protein, partial [Actinomycetes bacterium]
MNIKLPGIAMRNASVLNTVETPIIIKLKKEAARLCRVVVAISIAVTTALPFAVSSNALADNASNNVAPGTSNNTSKNNNSPVVTSGTSTPITPTVTPVTTPGTATSPVAAQTIPSVPSGLVVTPGDQKLTVQWDAPTETEKVTGYAVSSSTDGRTWTPVDEARTSANTAVVLEGLTNGVVVFVQVAAINAAGTGASISSSGTPAAVASAPRGAAVVSTPANGTPYANAVTANNPAGYWQFADTPSNTTADGSAVGNLSGVPAFGMPAPIGGMTAGYLQGKELISDVVVNDSFTLEGWVNPSSVNGDAATVAHVGNTTNGSFMRVTQGGALQFVAFVNGVASKVESARGLIPSGSWSQLAAAYGNGSVALYVNGTQVASGSATAAGGTYVIGGSNDSGFTFSGSIAHFAVYRSVLSSADVNSHWNAANYQVGTGTTPSARAGDAFVIMEWSAPASDGGSRILGYNVQVNTSAGWVDAIRNTFSSSTSAFVTQWENGTRLANGTSYEFRVRAVTSVGVGDASNAISATPRGLASAPTSFGISVPTPGHVAINWAAPANNGGFDITGYRIEISSDNTSWRTYASTSSDTATLTMTDVVTGTPFADEIYFFRVRAESSAGAGQTSVSIPVAPQRETQPARTQSVLTNNAQPTVAFTREQSALSAEAILIDVVARAYVAGNPVPPSNLLATTSSNNQVTLTWVAPTRTSVSSSIDPITGYRIETSADNGATWITVTPSTGSTALTYVIDGVTNGVSRLFRVAALSATTTGSFASVSITPGVIASSPRNFTAVGTGDGSISLTWTAPLNTGGSPILSYVLDYCTTASCTASTVIDSGVPASETSYNVTGMLNQQGGITFRLRAITTAGTGDSATVVARTAPQVSAPNALTGVADVTWEGLSNQAYLSWSAPTLLYGQTVVGYQYEQSSDGGATWIVLNNLITNTLSTYVQGLTAGTTYQFRVAARTSQGLGLYNYVSVTPTGSATYTGSIATSPLNLRATVDGAATVLLTWAAPSYTGGLPLLGYRIKYQSTTDPAAAVSGAVNTLVPAGTTQYRLSGLATGSNYFARVTPVTDVGEGDYAAVGFIQYDTPSAPRTLTTTPGDGTVTLAWAAVGTTGGYNVYGYRVEQSSDGVNWTVLTLDTSALSFTARGINNGSTYQFRVAAVTAVGIGDYANIVATPYTTPNAPLNLIATPGNEQVTLNWTAPSNNGNAITQYIVETSTDNGSTWTEVGRVVGATNTTFTHTGLYNGWHQGTFSYYVYRVSAVNNAGTGVASTTAPTSPGNTPSSVTGLYTYVYNTMVQLNWGCCLGDGTKGPFYQGAAHPVVAYRIEQSTDNGATWQFLFDRPAAWTWARISALRNGVTYQFRVSAINDLGVGVPTTISAVPSTTPDSPTNMAVTTSVTANAATATVTWAAPVTDGGSPVTGYRVRWCATANCNPTTVLSDSLSPSTFSYVVSGLTTGTTYNISVEAENENGFSPNQTQLPVFPVGLPTAVTALSTSTANTVTVTNPDGSTGTGTYLTVSWNDPNAISGVPVFYKVELSSNSGTSWTTLTDATTSLEQRWAP